MNILDLIVIGGGPAGIFAAIHASAHCSVTVLEQSDSCLKKLLLSGGGRCNLTNGETDLQAFAENYPRGKKEILGPLHRFGPKETMQWFSDHKVALKMEKDGRIFPVSNSSKEIFTTLLEAAKECGVEIKTSVNITDVEYKDNLFHIHFQNTVPLISKTLLLATGSSPFGFQIAKKFGHTIIPPIPALFPLKINAPFFHSLSGQVLEKVTVQIPHTPFTQTDPVLCTQNGLSGPAAIRLSSKAARYLYEKGYRSELFINFLPDYTTDQIVFALTHCKQTLANKQVSSVNPFSFSKSFWTLFTNILGAKTYKNLSLKEIEKLAQRLHQDTYMIEGKVSHKEEFVTCGGIARNEVDFRSMQSKKIEGLFFAGEILDIDGLTGGFNLQNSWTTGAIAGDNASLYGTK